MEAGSRSGARDTRVIADTCSALKLLAVGRVLFELGQLSLGDLVLHPRLFNETKRWDADKQLRYAPELKLAGEIRATAGIAVGDPDRSRIEIAIKATRDACNLSVGQADIEQLTSLIHFDLKLVTNDRQFAELTRMFEIEVYSAEAILLEAINDGVITKEEAIKALHKWRANGERPMAKVLESSFRQLGISIYRGFISDN